MVHINNGSGSRLCKLHELPPAAGKPGKDTHAATPLERMTNCAVDEPWPLYWWTEDSNLGPARQSSPAQVHLTTWLLPSREVKTLPAIHGRSLCPSRDGSSPMLPRPRAVQPLGATTPTHPDGLHTLRQLTLTPSERPWSYIGGPSQGPGLPLTTNQRCYCEHLAAEARVGVFLPVVLASYKPG